jgi:hypothetical protein
VRMVRSMKSGVLLQLVSLRSQLMRGVVRSYVGGG